MLITSGANIATVKVEKHRVSFCQRFWIDSEGREFEKQWYPLATICKDILKRGETWTGPPRRIQHHKASTEAEGKNCCSFIEFSSACLRVRPSRILYHVYKNDQMWHLEGKMKTEESIHRDTVKCLNYIPVKITRSCIMYMYGVAKCKKIHDISFHLKAMEC